MGETQKSETARRRERERRLWQHEQAQRRMPALLPRAAPRFAPPAARQKTEGNLWARRNRSLRRRIAMRWLLRGGLVLGAIWTEGALIAGSAADPAWLWVLDVMARSL